MQYIVEVTYTTADVLLSSNVNGVCACQITYACFAMYVLSQHTILLPVYTRNTTFYFIGLS